jgi:hypothetical protein
VAPASRQRHEKLFCDRIARLRSKHSHRLEKCGLPLDEAFKRGEKFRIGNSGALRVSNDGVTLRA